MTGRFPNEVVLGILSFCTSDTLLTCLRVNSRIRVLILTIVNSIFGDRLFNERVSACLLNIQESNEKNMQVRQDLSRALLNPQLHIKSVKCFGDQYMMKFMDRYPEKFEGCAPIVVNSNANMAKIAGMPLQIVDHKDKHTKFTSLVCF